MDGKQMVTITPESQRQMQAAAPTPEPSSSEPRAGESLRDFLRRKTIGAPSGARVQRVKVEIAGEQVEVEIRQPSMKRLEELDTFMQKSGNVAGMVEFVIECVFPPGEAKPLFTPADRGTLAATPPGGWVMKLAELCAENAKPAENGEAAKNG